MEVYGVVSQDCCILHKYWDRLWMVAHAEGYYGAAFKGFWGVMQGDPLSSTILMWW